MKKQLAKNTAVIIFSLILVCVAVILVVAGCDLRPETDDGHTHSYTETVIAPTCTVSGYTLHACDCGNSYQDAFVDATGHTPKAAVRENEVAADCTTDGSYDEVVYCNKCGEKLSSVHKTVEKLGHDYKDGFCSVCGESELHFNVEDLQFTLSEDQSYYIVSGFNGNPTYANIPYTYLDKPVTSVAARAFYNCSSLTSVIIPNSVTSIGKSAFEGCSNLTSLKLSDRLDVIDDSVFYHCSALKNLIIPDGVTSINNYAFEGCNALITISIPNSLISIGKSAFSLCAKVTSIYYTGDVAEWCNIFGIGNLMEYATNKKLYFNGQELTELIIPDSVKSIGDETFYGCSGLESVTIGEGVTSIGKHAFKYCTSLETVYWNATNCTGGWFVESSSIVSVSHMFSDCDNLTTVVIGENVQSIPAYAFYYSSLKSVTIPDSVKSIGKNAFKYCSRLESVTIGKGVTFIGNEAFRLCESLEIVYWNATNCAGGWTNDGQIYPIFYECDKFATVVIGVNVQSIPDYLFYHCDSLKSVIIPDGVTSIGNYAFKYCIGLESVTIGEDVTTIGKGAFQNCNSLETVYWNAIECEGGWLSGTSISALFTNSDKFTTLVIGEEVEYIPDYAFYKCSSLKSVILSASVYSIGKSAFYGCSGLNTVFYLGGEDDYFTAYDGNTEFMENLYYYSEDEPTSYGQWWHYDEDGKMVIWEEWLW